MTFTNGVSTFNLKDGEERKAKGLPANVTYSVTEEILQEFSTNSIGAAGTYDQTKSYTAEFTNTRKKADVTVKKQLTDTTDSNKFPFTVTLKDGSTTISDYEVWKNAQDSGRKLVTNEQGQVTFELHHNEEQKLTVPVGTTMIIEESADGYTATVEAEHVTGVQDGKKYTIQVPAEEASVTFTNAISAKKLRIRKTGDDAPGGLAGSVFSLEADESIEGFTDLTGVESMNGDQDPTKKGYLPGNDPDDSKLFILPTGVYKLTETETPDYYEGLSDYVTINVTAEDINVMPSVSDRDLITLSAPDIDGIRTLTVQNSRKKASVTVIKNVAGTEADKDSQYSFNETGLTSSPETFKLYGRQKKEMVDGAETIVQDNTRTYAEISCGSSWSISEIIDDNGDFSTSVDVSYVDENGDTQKTTVEGSGTGQKILTADTTVTFTNTRVKHHVSIWKTGLETSTSLSGASFVLYRAVDFDDNTNTPRKDAQIVAQGITGVNGILDLGKLTVEMPDSQTGTGPGAESGTEYRLVETAAPAGYDMLEAPVKIIVYPGRITAMQGNSSAEVSVKGDTYWVGGQEDDTLQIRIWNNPGVVLPSTGGPGTTLIHHLGLLLTGLAGIGLLLKRNGHKRNA